MKAGLIRVLVASVIAAAAINIVLFAVPFEHNAVFWLCYAFVWIAVGLLAVVNYYLFNAAKTDRGVVYRTSTVAVSVGYLLLALLIGIVFMAIGSVPLWLALVVHIVLLAGCLFAILGGDTGAKLVESDEVRTQVETSFMRSMQTQVNSALAFSTDERSKRALQEVSDKVRFSDPVSNESVAFIEQQLASFMVQMNAAVGEGNADAVESVCAQMLQALDQRNAIVRQTK